MGGAKKQNRAILTLLSSLMNGACSPKSWMKHDITSRTKVVGIPVQVYHILPGCASIHRGSRRHLLLPNESWNMYNVHKNVHNLTAFATKCISEVHEQTLGYNIIHVGLQFFSLCVHVCRASYYSPELLRHSFVVVYQLLQGSGHHFNRVLCDGTM